jgi:hypothetical protein
VAPARLYRSLSARLDAVAWPLIRAVSTRTARISGGQITRTTMASSQSCCSITTNMPDSIATVASTGRMPLVTMLWIAKVSAITRASRSPVCCRS